MNPWIFEPSPREPDQGRHQTPDGDGAPQLTGTPRIARNGRRQDLREPARKFHLRAQRSRETSRARRRQSGAPAFAPVETLSPTRFPCLPAIRGRRVDPDRAAPHIFGLF